LDRRAETDEPSLAELEDRAFEPARRQIEIVAKYAAVEADSPLREQ
jgi:hypothetical protein